MKLAIKFILIIVLSIQSQYGFSWGMTGHRVIAEIAEQHLTRKAKRNIQKLIGHQKLAYWSNWADFIKSSPDPYLSSTGSWHFLNTEGNLSFEQFYTAIQDTPDHNLYKAYTKNKMEVVNDDLDIQKRREALYFMIHLLADAHQPMHVSRAIDLGGNKISVKFFGRDTNIHRVWDSDLVDNEKYSFLEYATVLDYEKHFYKQYTQSSFEEWLYESHELANIIYDDVAKNNNLSYAYIYNFKDSMELCLLKAGLRLGKELNELFG